MAVLSPNLAPQGTDCAQTDRAVPVQQEKVHDSGIRLESGWSLAPIANHYANSPSRASVSWTMRPSSSSVR